MGLFDFFSSGSSPDQDNANGVELLTAYFDEASEFPNNFPYANAREFMDYLTNRQGYDYVTGLGETLRNAEAATSKSDAVERLRDLAYQSQGKATPSQITMVTGGAGTGGMNWGLAVSEVTSETASELADVAQNVGKGVIGTLNMTKYLPLILLGAGAIFVFVYAKGSKKVL